MLRDALVLAFAITGCFAVDLPLPVDGQVYACEVACAGDHVESRDACAPWTTDGWLTAAREVASTYDGRPECEITCDGTRAACGYRP